MFNILANVSCGDGAIVVDSMIPNFVSTIVTIIKIVIPIILIVLGLIDLGKATIAQMTFVKRIIAAVLVFFVVAIVQLVFGLLNRSSNDSGNAVNSCIDCFINGSCTDEGEA